MVVISGARALRHPLPNGRRAPCRRPKQSAHAPLSTAMRDVASHLFKTPGVEKFS
jgi:hypothetical protein